MERGNHSRGRRVVRANRSSGGHRNGCHGGFVWGVLPLSTAVERGSGGEVPLHEATIMNTHTNFVPPGRPTWVEIDLGAIAGNVRRLREIAGPRTDVMAVVKAD